MNVHIEVTRKIYDLLPGLGLTPAGFGYSPIKGPKGNIEYLLYAVKGGHAAVTFEEIQNTVRISHEEL